MIKATDRTNKDSDLGSFLPKEAESSRSQPPQSQNSPKTHPPSGVENNNISLEPSFAVKEKTIEQIVLDVWDKNKELFLSKGAGFRKDFTIKVLERLVPPEFRKNFNYETIESALPFLCCFEDPNRVLRLIVHDGRITLPKELLEKRARTEKLYHDYYSPTNEQDNPDENNHAEGKGDVS